MATLVNLWFEPSGRLPGSFHSSRSIVETCALFKYNRDLRSIGSDGHVVPLAGGFLGVLLGRDQVVEGAGIVHPIARRVVQGDFDSGVDRIVQVADADEDARVATLGQLVIEIEHEVGELCLMDDEIAAGAVRIQTVGLHVVLGNGLLVAEDPAGAGGSVEDGPEFLVGRGGRRQGAVPQRSDKS